MNTGNSLQKRRTINCPYVSRRLSNESMITKLSDYDEHIDGVRSSPSKQPVNQLGQAVARILSIAC